MDDFLSAVKTGIPDWAILLSFLAMSIFIGLSFNTKTSRKHIRSLVYASLLVEYLFLLLSTTVIFRKAVPTHVEWIPFWSYRAALDNSPYVSGWGLFLNVVVFIPIGFLLTNWIRGKHGWLKIGSLGFCISLSIELLQLILNRGVCEVDDLMHNTLGTIIGYMLFITMLKFSKNKR